MQIITIFKIFISIQSKVISVIVDGYITKNAACFKINIYYINLYLFKNYFTLKAIFFCFLNFYILIAYYVLYLNKYIYIYIYICIYESCAANL